MNKPRFPYTKDHVIEAYREGLADGMAKASAYRPTC